MLEGLPALSEYVIRMSTVARTRPCGSLAVVVYHALGDLANAAEHALTHYFPLTLTEPYLQNSSFGPPYTKWAFFTNKDFRTLDACAREVALAGWRTYDEAVPSCPDNWTRRDARHWFHSVFRSYASCVVNEAEPSLKLGAVTFEGWVEPGANAFSSVISARPGEKPIPPTLVFTARDISDRTAIAELREFGLANIRELRRQNERFAQWLRGNCTIEDLTAPHEGTLSNEWRDERRWPAMPPR